MMSKRISRLILLLLLINFTGCMTQKEDMQIKDLDVSSIKFKHSDTTLSTRQKAIDNYKNYIQKSTLKENHSTALKRLADLELKSGETVNADDQVKIAEAEAFTLSSIKNYKAYLKTYPRHKDNDQVLYQLAKAYSYAGNTAAELKTLNAIVKHYPGSKYINEIQFRRGEINFTGNSFIPSELAFSAVVKSGKKSIYYEKALYKLGWAQFKQSKYLKSLATYFRILDNKQLQGKITAGDTYQHINRGEKDFIDDTLRAINLALSYTNGTKTIQDIFSKLKNRNYDALIYKSFAEFYLEKDRYEDAAQVFLAYGQSHPEAPLAAIYTSLAIKAYAAGSLHEHVLSTKKSFVKKYNTDTTFWLALNTTNKAEIKNHLILHIKDLSAHWHTLAQKTKKQADLSKAVYWYNTHLNSFPDDKTTPEMNFLLAELLFDLGKYDAALKEYITTGYTYPTHDKNTEAAYAAILTYNKLVDAATPGDKTRVKSKAIRNAILFSNTYPDDKNADKVITKTAEDLFIIKDYKQASDFAKRITYKKDLEKSPLATTAWTVYAHSLFELGDYIGSEHTYKEVIKRLKPEARQYRPMTEKLAASIYRQAEIKRDKGDIKQAAYHFNRLGQIVPNSTIRITSDYDAATMYIQLEQWRKAITVLNDFKLRYPTHKKYAYGIAEKLALAYTKSEKFSQAAKQLSLLANMAIKPEAKRTLSWQSAEMHTQASDHKTANEIYINYIKQYPSPFAQNIEAHKLVSDYYLNNKQHKPWYSWLRKTVNAESRAGNQRSNRSNLIAAQAVMHLTRPLLDKFKQAKLSIPLNKSLKNKKRLMQLALKSYSEAIEYKIAEITTESTYKVAEIYHHFAQALMQSQRPSELSEEELEQYDILLEEQAYPFEEKMLDIHSSNAKRTQHGTYDHWVKASLNELAKMQPVRYSKEEKLDDYVSVAP